LAEQWQEQCAKRMTRLLNGQPRKGKTRAYLKTLPKRSGLIFVTPDDFPPVSRAMARQSEEAQAVRDAQRYADWEARGKAPSPSSRRKDRLRPRRGRDSIRERLYHAQEGLCSLCRGQISSPSAGTIEHVVPLALGGGNSGNRLLAHEHCNNKKGASPPTRRELDILAAVNELLAQAGEAGTAETTQIGSVHDHAVTK